ncbi:serine/threonine-protein kinase [uncultured Pseudokineococcus sp.]|uniref:serine/threonine-protein kinase n=1 Tax=uncultured Pseudokineococcus sp. TaxID=1642928 RepID=UPI002635693D|nr:serine/threonine-protein kinase [uncultured Pseudokineococcus sp.]
MVGRHAARGGREPEGSDDGGQGPASREGLGPDRGAGEEDDLGGSSGPPWWERLEDRGAEAAPWPLRVVPAEEPLPGLDLPVDSGDGPAEGPAVAPVVPGWTVQRLLGRGGSGEVWRAVEEATGEAAALKVLRTSVPVDEAARARLRDEAALAAALDGPHLVRLQGVTETAATAASPPRPVLVLEHALGGSLGALVAARGALDAGEVVTLLVPLAGALADLHASGVVHGDVSPGNVLFAEDGRPLLADLGTAGLVAAAPAAGGGPPLVELTPGYADPQRLAGASATPAGDVHALAACAWHALAALPPGPVSQRPPLVVLRPDLPRPLVDLLEDCLEADPERRPDARALASRAWGCAAAEPVRLVPTDPGAPPDEVVTHRVRAAARRGAASPDAAPSEGTGRRRRRRSRRGAAGGRRRPSAPTAVLAAAGAAAVVALVALLVPLVLPDAGASAAGAPGAPSSAAGPTGTPTQPGGTASPAARPARPTASAAGPTAEPPADPAVDPPEGLVADPSTDDPVAAVTALAALRDRGFATRDAAPLERASAAGSPALAADMAELEALTRRGERLAGLETVVVRAERAPVPDGAGASTDDVLVDVVTRSAAHRLVADDGNVLAVVAEGQDVPARLRLVRREDGWAVQEVLAPS